MRLIDKDKCPCGTCFELKCVHPVKCKDFLNWYNATADAAPVVHGIWIGESDGYADGEPVVDVWYCSECDHCIDDGTDDESLLPNYCPDCGAKMDGKTYKQEVPE